MRITIFARCTVFTRMRMWVYKAYINRFSRTIRQTSSTTQGSQERLAESKRDKADVCYLMNNAINHNQNIDYTAQGRIVNKVMLKF